MAEYSSAVQERRERLADARVYSEVRVTVDKEPEPLGSLCDGVEKHLNGTVTVWHGEVPADSSSMGQGNPLVAGLHYGVWDSFGCPTFWRIGKREDYTPFYAPYVADTLSEPDDGTYEPEDIGLVGMGWRELMSLQDKGHVSGVPAYDSTFRHASLISVKHRLDKPLWIIFYPVFIAGRDEWTDWGVGLPMNDLWCQFSSIFDSGEAVRSVQLEYQNAVASYIYCGILNSNGEQTWVKLDGEEVVHQYNWGMQTRKLYDRYPASIEIGGIKTWSTINPAMTLTVVGDSVDILDWRENPSLGKRRNPKPDIVMLEPDKWSGPKPTAIAFQPSEPISSPSAPEVTLRDRLKNEVTLPEQKEERLLQNGDFEAGLDGWQKGYGTDHMDSIRFCEVIYDDVIQSNVAEFKREKGGSDGSTVGIYQDIFIDLDRHEDVRLKLDVKPVFQSLTGGGWAGGVEYPVTVQIAFIDQRNEPHLWSHGFYYKDISRYDDATNVDEKAWFSYVSPSLKGIVPDCADKARASDRTAWGGYVPEYKPPVIPKYITRLLIFGAGWDFEGRADNIELAMLPHAGGDSDE